MSNNMRVEGNKKGGELPRKRGVGGKRFVFSHRKRGVFHGYIAAKTGTSRIGDGGV